MPKTLTLTYTYGPSGSGKSTWARKEQERDQSIVLTSRDDIRSMLHQSKWSKSNEIQVVEVQNFIITDALSRGRSVIVHDTNLHPSNEARFERLASEHNARLVEHDLSWIPLETCIERDLRRPASVGEQVIRRQFRDYLMGKPTDPPVFDPSLPDAIIVDMDGTLALNVTGRSFYDETGLCADDAVNEPIARVVRNEATSVYRGCLPTKVLICSGRFDTPANREATERWLDKVVPYHAVFMRPAGDQRKDSIIKGEIYENEIKGKYNVIYVLDDRQSVVTLWRGLGLTCLQVADGDF